MNHLKNHAPGQGTILAIEDDRASLELLKMVLTKEGYEVHPAANGKQALESIATALPELILLDIGLPDIDGFEICHQIKAQERTNHIPIIFISATTETKERVKGFKLGAVDFVSKPFQREELLARVHTHLHLTRMQAEIKRQAADLREANALLHHEIAERETTASALAESEEKFRTLADSAQDSFVMLDDEDRIIFWNRAAKDMFGYTAEEITGKKFHSTFTNGLTLPLVDNATQTTGKVIELTVLKRNGAELPVELSLATVELREKGVTIAVIRDITGRQRAQETLRRSEERLNLALEASRMGTWDLDLATGKVWHSRIHDQIFGYETPTIDWTYDKFLSHIVPDGLTKFHAEMALAKTTGVINSECRINRTNDNHQRWISIRGTVQFNKQNVPIRMMGFVVDITEGKLAEEEQKNVEAQNSLSQKLESVGRLASGVAHEINTPMQFITDNTQFLKGAMTSLTGMLTAYRAAIETITSGNNLAEAVALVRAEEEKNELDYLLEEIPRTFSETMSGLQRVTLIIRSLKEFSHPNKSSKQPADLNKAIGTTITISRHEWKYVADLVTELDPDLPMIPLQIDEMNQVVLNLIVNASHAIGDALKQRGSTEKGVITIRTKQVENNILIEVQDNGTGIPESAQSHIFEPFFTTKGVGKGTGQGLAIIRTIVVKNHNGTIGFITEPGKGTTFQIRLPIPAAEEPVENVATT